MRGERRGAGGATDEMNRFSKELIQSLSEAVAHAEGKKAAARVHVIEGPEVRAIRKRLCMPSKPSRAPIASRSRR